MVGGRAIVVQMIQMRSSTDVTTSLVILGERGLMIALLLSRVMASMVNTLAGTVEKEMNWLMEQYRDPKYQFLCRIILTGVQVTNLLFTHPSLM